MQLKIQKTKKRDGKKSRRVSGNDFIAKIS